MLCRREIATIAARVGGSAYEFAVLHVFVSLKPISSLIALRTAHD